MPWRGGGYTVLLRLLPLVGACSLEVPDLAAPVAVLVASIALLVRVGGAQAEEAARRGRALRHERGRTLLLWGP